MVADNFLNGGLCGDDLLGLGVEEIHVHRIDRDVDLVPDCGGTAARHSGHERYESRSLWSLGRSGFGCLGGFAIRRWRGPGVEREVQVHLGTQHLGVLDCGMDAPVGGHVTGEGRVLHVLGPQPEDQLVAGVLGETRMCSEGPPPYLVRWQDGHESLFFPSSDTRVEHRPAKSQAS